VSIRNETFDDYGYRRRWLVATRKHELAARA